MTWGQVRRRLVRAGGALQLAAFTATAASFVATLGGPLWRQSRPGCVSDGCVYCTTSGVDVAAARWPAVIAGVVVTLVVAGTTGRLYRAAQALALLVVVSGTAIFTADQSRYGGDSALWCWSGAGGECAFLPGICTTWWSVRSWASPSASSRSGARRRAAAPGLPGVSAYDGPRRTSSSSAPSPSCWSVC